MERSETENRAQADTETKHVGVREKYALAKTLPSAKREMKTASPLSDPAHPAIIVTLSLSVSVTVPTSKYEKYFCCVINCDCGQVFVVKFCSLLLCNSI